MPDASDKSTTFAIRSGVSMAELAGRKRALFAPTAGGREPYLHPHWSAARNTGQRFRRCVATTVEPKGQSENQLRQWEKHDFRSPGQRCLPGATICIHWMRAPRNDQGDEYEFRGVTDADLERERIVEDFIAEHLAEWQARGWIPDMRIELGEQNGRARFVRRGSDVLGTTSGPRANPCYSGEAGLAQRGGSGPVRRSC